jgi:hypothetical protein
VNWSVIYCTMLCIKKCTVAHLDLEHNLGGKTTSIEIIIKYSNQSDIFPE